VIVARGDTMYSLQPVIESLSAFGAGFGVSVWALVEGSRVIVGGGPNRLSAGLVLARKDMFARRS
jgi:hypothetical protein